MWKLRRVFVLCVVVGMLSTACAGMRQETAQRPRTLSEVQVELEGARRQFADAYQRRDAKAIGELFAEDAAFTGTISPVWRQGRGEIQANWARVFEAYPQTRFVFRDPVIRMYNTSREGTVTENTVLVEIGYFDMFMTDAAGQVTHTPGKYSMTRIWRDGRWQIVNMQSGPVPSQREQRP